MRNLNRHWAMALALALLWCTGCAKSGTPLGGDVLGQDQLGSDTAGLDSLGDVPRFDTSGDIRTPTDLTDSRDPVDMRFDGVPDGTLVDTKPADVLPDNGPWDTHPDDADGQIPDLADAGDVTLPAPQCQAVAPALVTEICNAANLFVWDGSKCVGTCLGCCGCEPFCGSTFNTMELCQATCGETCPTYQLALAEGPFQYFVEYGGSCPVRLDRERCDADSDCPIPELGEAGQHCVQGNCVFCWDDSACLDGKVCRGGRCVEPAAAFCPAIPTCTDPGCHLVPMSETNCPICVCDTFMNIPCQQDGNCQVYSFHPFMRCVYGRCAECRVDADCGFGGRCQAPGICMTSATDPSLLWGTWLIGWSGGMDHYSYLRFEADGTLRRGHYVEEVSWSDDIPGMPCWAEPVPLVEFPVDLALIGTWEIQESSGPEVTVNVSLNTSCDPGEGYGQLWTVTLNAQADGMTLTASPEGMPLEGHRVEPATCTPDFHLCDTPSYTL